MFGDIMKGFYVKITIHHKGLCLLQDSQMAREKGNIDFCNTAHLINRIYHLAICGKQAKIDIICDSRLFREADIHIRILQRGGKKAGIFILPETANKARFQAKPA